MPHPQDLSPIPRTGAEVAPYAVPGQWITTPGERWGMLAYARHFFARDPILASLLPVTALLPLLFFGWGRWVVVGCAIAALLRGLRHQRRDSLSDLAFVPLDLPQHAVDVTFTYKDSYYGSDSGILTLCEGWLHYQGRLTSFSLRRSDIGQLRVDPLGNPRYILSGGVEWTHTKIQIQPIAAHSDLEGKTYKRFGHVLDEELELWKGPRPGQAILPPQAPHPMAYARLRWACVPAILCIVALGCVYYFMPTGNESEKLLSIVLRMAITFMALTQPRRVGNAFMTLRQMRERAEKD